MAADTSLPDASLPAVGPIEDFWAVIPAGGAGTRLWPLSRSDSPKFLHDLTGNARSLLQDTVDRLTPLAEDRFLVVTGAAHRDAVRGQLPQLGAGSVVAEPSARDSMAAIGLAAALLELRAPDAVMGSFAADHVITQPALFEECVRRAVAAAREDWLVTLGIDPTHPATGFGYIHVGDPLPGLDASHVRAFVEKPSAEVATGYLASGVHRWNAGMFVVRPTVLLDLLGQWHPDFAADLRALAAAAHSCDEGADEAALDAALERWWPGLPKIALDHAVAEPAAAVGRVAVVPGGFGWEDIGDFHSLDALLRTAEEDVVVLGDRSLVQTVDARGLVVPGGGRTVAVVGLDDVVVVDTGDALLVTTLERAQDVKAVVAALKRAGRDDLT
ncbi:mannose-1-phosphate guanylyltransferase [Nocardioides pacificus]